MLDAVITCWHIILVPSNICRLSLLERGFAHFALPPGTDAAAALNKSSAVGLGIFLVDFFFIIFNSFRFFCL